MLTEDLLFQIFDLFSSESIDSEQITSLFGAIRTIVTYIDYLDPIVPVGLLISCAGLILGWTVICCVVRLILYIM